MNYVKRLPRSYRLDYVELWLSGAGLLIIGVVLYLFIPQEEVWTFAALTAMTIGLLYGMLLWPARRRRADVYADVSTRAEAKNERLQKRDRERIARVEERAVQMRRLAQHIQLEREEERARVAHEVHDNLGQALASLQFDVTWLARRVEEESLQEKLRGMSAAITAMTRAAQEITTELRPGLLDELGIIAALEWQTRQFEEHTSICATFSTGCEEVALSRDRTTALFRIFQEALTNVVRHAEASQVNAFMREVKGDLVLVVEDDGRGIRAHEAERPDSLGILGMRVRAAEWGGRLDLEPLPHGGTRLKVQLPINEKEPIAE